MVRPAAKREAVANLRTAFQMSERRACSLIVADRSSIRYRSCRPPDLELRGQLCDLANARRRFGYRRLFVLLRQQGNELLNETLFFGRDHARQTIGSRVDDYNAARPHSSPSATAPPGACCSLRAAGRINRRDSNRRRMKDQGQVSNDPSGDDPTPRRRHNRDPDRGR